MGVNLPPSSNTGATLTKLEDMGLEIGIHDYAGTTFMDLDDVLTFLTNYFNDSVEIKPYGLRGYSEGYQVGHVEVYSNSDRPEMGVHILIRGKGSDAIGTKAIFDMMEALELRTSRGDVYIDHCPFSPSDIRDEWRAGNVRTPVKEHPDSLKGRSYKRSDWDDSNTGDTFYMGSRSSQRYARCYNKRGYTRFELEIKGKRAAITFEALKMAFRASPEKFAEAAVGAIRDFVDFVQPETDLNISRAELLPFWEIFTAGIARARIVLAREIDKDFVEVVEYIAKNYAPLLSVIYQGMGWIKFREMVKKGKTRVKPKHRKMLKRHLLTRTL